ncbi:MAG TPA: hypothetical protein VEA77_07565 [Hyphomicrobium sp.]|nr:hypothetical protein [Hyphomicrobium sp.]
MDHKSDPRPPKKPVLPSQPDERERPNVPVEPSGDSELSQETPPEEQERDQDPRSRDPL